jgi:hypothetical protein
MLALVSAPCFQKKIDFDVVAIYEHDVTSYGSDPVKNRFTIDLYVDV